MQSKGATIVSNLQESRDTLSRIKASLKSRELVCDKANLTRIFSNIKCTLLETVKFMNRIARLDLAQLQNSGEQGAKVQSLADSVQRKLVKARIDYAKITEDLLPNNEKVQYEMDELDSNFRNLLDLYSNQIHHSHLSFQKLNKPDVSLLSLDTDQQLLGKDLFKQHRNLVLIALKKFTQAPDLSTVNASTKNNTNKSLGKAMEMFFPQLVSLSQELTNDVDLIYQDCDELILKDEFNTFDGEQSPYLEKFIHDINQILEQEDLSISFKPVLEAVQGDLAYSRLTEDLIDVASSSKQIKLGELSKVLLTLQALRLKNQNLNSYKGFDINLKSIHEMNNLGTNDRTSSPELEALDRISHRVEQFLRDMNIPTRQERLKNRKQAPIIEITKEAEAIMTNSDVNITIYKLKQEKNADGGIKKALMEPDSEISKLIKKYQIIFLKSGFDQESLINLDNSKLMSMVDKITKTANDYNSINIKQAAELIYILARSFAIDMSKKI